MVRRVENIVRRLEREPRGLERLRGRAERADGSDGRAEDTIVIVLEGGTAARMRVGWTAKRVVITEQLTMHVGSTHRKITGSSQCLPSSQLSRVVRSRTRQGGSDVLLLLLLRLRRAVREWKRTELLPLLSLTQHHSGHR